ncbi:uncharacterized protein LOC126835601 isoform X5 [Adelges cooleyi]|uniref:uncharacterized protein LOC126835601 isoform X5 n=1 Tax=Adelges cooleyi TaxID=133065 RepID=UPI0021800AFE|nr:uncharacterized protein LOC126835601 isoform X5 [Adelges cooleyi]
MKLCCILLISFALKNVFAPTFLRIDFKRQIILTNDYIYQAASKNKLHTVVKNIVCGPSSVEDVAIMLAVPELAHTRYLGQCINRETSIGTELNIVLPLHIPDISDDVAQRFELETLGKIRRNQTKKAIKTLIISAIRLFRCIVETNRISISPFCVASSHCSDVQSTIVLNYIQKKLLLTIMIPAPSLLYALLPNIKS